jgi:uncharacterized protein (TIGR02757 family)
MNQAALKALLDEKADLYNQPAFIAGDPVSIPHLFTDRRDIEIAGLFAALFAWGNRTTIIGKARELMQAMEWQPHAFCRAYDADSIGRLANFRHRTFNFDDCCLFIDVLHRHYQQHDTLETAFFPRKGMSVEEGLNHFRHYFFSTEHLKRSEKHVASPAQGSACKRLNMYLRWMVRRDKRGVDFGIWKRVSPAQLIMPLDLHVARVARSLQLITRKQNDWQTARELTERLKEFDVRDPVRYDFALFGIGVMEKPTAKTKTTDGKRTTGPGTSK